MDKQSKIFNGTYTLVNTEIGTYVTLKVHTAQNGALKGKRIVSKLVGRDNESSYEGFAFIFKDDGINVWRSKRNPKNWQIMKILRSLIINGERSRWYGKVELKLSKKCMRCNRKLTTPKSIEDGIGPECIKKGMAF